MIEAYLLVIYKISSLQAAIESDPPFTRIAKIGNLFN